MNEFNKRKRNREDFRFSRAVAVELARARAKFPDAECSMTALTEEVGELAKALLDETPSRIFAEAVQVAVMAMRVATEGDSSIESYRKKRRRAGGKP